MNICIYGASSNQPGEVYFQDAETLGRLIPLFSAAAGTV